MDPLSVTASIIAVLQLSNAVVSYCISFSLQMKGADGEIKEVISELKALQDILTQVRAVLPENDQSKNPEVAGVYSALETTNSIISDISDRLAPLLKGGLKSRFKWPFEGKLIQEKLEKLQKQKSTFQLFFTLQQNKLVIEQSNDTTNLVNKAEENHRIKILNWYKTSDPEQNHKTSREQHEPQTCGWVFEIESFKSWTAGNGESLWIHGIPGAGKTIICSTIIEYMKKQSPPLNIVYYYFDFSDAKKQSFGSFLRSAIYQLLEEMPEIPEAATDLYETHLGLQQPTNEEFSKVFMALVSKTKVFVIVDAIDECPRQERSSFFQNFVGKLHPNINLLMTSRREHDIERALDGIFTNAVSIEDSKVDEDVRIHVANAMAAHPAFQCWKSTTLRKEVLDTIVAGCRGMFRWAVCQLDVMKQCFNPRMVRAELGRMPKTLDQTYDRILQAVPDTHKTFVQSALQWLAFSERPLLLSELGEAAVIDPSYGPFNADESRFLDPGKILELCGSLIVLGSKKYEQRMYKTNDWLFHKLDIESGHYSARILDTSYTTVSLSHYSVKEYLISERLQTGSLSEYFMTEKLSHRFLTKCAIVYLQGLGQGEVLSRRAYTEYPFLEYCAVNWMKHFNKGEIDDTFIDFIMEFLDISKPAAYINWLNSYNPDWDVPENPHTWKSTYGPDSKADKSLEKFASPLYWAALLRSSDLATRLIESVAEINAPARGFFGSPLSIASYYGVEELVQKLLSIGADPNGKGGHFGTILQSAAAGGSQKVVEMLIKAGADVNKTGGAQNTALIAAATYGHEAVVSFLLKSNPDAIIESSSYACSALYQAALAGHVKTTVRLLGAGFDINQLGSHGTPLYAASLKGSIDLVQILLNRGADVNKGGRGQWGYPLIAAAREGNASLVKVLLRAGADVNVKSDPTWFDPIEMRKYLLYGEVSALLAAVVSRDLETFKTIMDAKGLDLQDHRRYNSLSAALANGQLDMAKILIERGAIVSDDAFIRAIRIWKEDPWFLRTMLERYPSVNAHHGYEGSALHLAIGTGDEEVVRLILSKDPYIDALSNRGSVLVYAIERGMTGIAKELIKRGADIHKELPKYRCPFHCAMVEGEEHPVPDFPIANMLLEMGVDINCAGRRPIRSAIANGCVSAIRYLGKHGADLNSVIEYGQCTPLQQAAMEGRIDIIEALLEFGADVNGPPGKLGTALHYAASSSGNGEAIFRLFLTKGAIINDVGLDCGIICTAYDHGLRSLVPELIDLSADVNKSYGDWTPLAMAIHKNDSEIEQLLRSHGAHLKNTGVEAVKEMIKMGSIEILEKILVGGIDPNLTDPDSNYCIPFVNTAIREGRKDMVELLISYGASPNRLRDAYYDPLRMAAEMDDQSMVEYLIQLGANPNEGNLNEWNSEVLWALTSAISNENFEIVDLLLDSGADIMNFNGQAFQTAASGGEKMLLYLLERVPSEYREKALDSALQEAAQRASLDLCELLLDMGANADFVGGKYGSPLHAVFSGTSTGLRSINDRTAVFKLLVEKGAKPKEIDDYPSVLVLAIKTGNPFFALRMLKAGADPNGKGDDEHDSPLQAAVEYQNSLAEPLILAGADVNAFGGKYSTALHVAARCHDSRRIVILLQHGAKLDVVSPRYGGVIQTAAEGFSFETPSVRTMELLYSHGASVHAIGGEHGNALQAAAVTDNLEAVQWLLEHGADPNTKGPGGTAAQGAIRERSWRVVSYLEQRYGQTHDFKLD
ncbi:hypothetical protein TWF506_006836 [Arthrobotrys conoides]|uniref:NACHT domain-containing protein n=1 Tax=Arthrobotrys conoides TaxID=74498 RepID=A0AAN8NHI5_9PEZI